MGRLLQRNAAVAVGIALVVNACSTPFTDHTGVASTAVPVTSSTGATSAPRSTTASDKYSYEVPFPVVDEGADRWTEAFFVAYGADEQDIGNGVDIGEEHGPYEPVVLDRDGYWRVADVYKSRVARYDSNGAYVDSAPTPELRPMAGMVVLDDGHLVATASGNRMAIISNTRVTLHPAGGAGNPTLIDSHGNSAFGFGTSGVIYEFTFDEDTLVVERGLEFYQGGDGGQYGFDAVNQRTLQLTLAQEGAAVQLVPVPDDGSGTEIAIGEPVRDRQGRTHVLIYGTSVGSPEVQRGAYVRLDGTELAATSPIPDIFSGWGWSLLTNLGVDNEDNALLTGVDEEGVRVWRFDG